MARGRTPKQRQVTAPTSQTDAAALQPPQRRGRPPKSRPVPDQLNDDATSTNEPPKRRGRPPKPKYFKDDAPESAKMSSATVTPKPRGRPPNPKYLSDDVSVSANASSSMIEAKLSPTRSGRPPKPKYLGDDVSESAMIAPAMAPKRRGRPPKPKSLKDDVSDSAKASSSLVEIAVLSKRSGRPPKPKAAMLVNDSSVSPKRRGRPPKKAPLAGYSALPVPLKRRGRPPKKIENGLSALSDERMDDTQDTEDGLVPVLKPFSLKRKAIALLDDLLALKRARAGRVLVFGTGECAQLGLTEDRTERKFPTPVDLNDRIVTVASGGLHNVAVSDDGGVWTWGCNDEKALGRGGDEWLPGRVTIPVSVVKVSAGDSHSMALGVDGRVYSWGAYRDSNGMMGFNPNMGEPFVDPIPVYLQGRRAVDIASGVNHSLVLLNNGHVYEWGHIRIGQRIARHHRMTLLAPRLVNVRNLGCVVRVFAGAYQSFAMTQAGRVYAFGMNQYGQAGVDGAGKDTLHKPEEVLGLRQRGVVKIVGGLHHSLALLESGQVLSFGRNNYGELGMGDLVERRTPTLVPDLVDIVDIACGSTHSLAVSKSGAAYSCGFGEMLQLGNGAAEDRTRFELVCGQQLESSDVVACSAGAQHSVVIIAPRTLLTNMDTK